MTVTVLATSTSTTQTKRREPLRREEVESKCREEGGNEENVNGAEKKRKADFYNEDVEGFQFSRITTKKAKGSKDVIPESPIPAPENQARQQSPRRGRPPKKRSEEQKSESVTVSKQTAAEGTGKRQKRGSTKSTAPEAEAEAEPEPQPERSTRSTRKRESGEHVPTERKRKKGRPSKSHEEKTNGFVSPEPQHTGTSTIALPLADTPVIQRNKEMRGAKSAKGNRRSSLGMRGRRASSLIDSGASNALPHKKVDTADFYKHIANDGLPEPRRMRQLLIWCATRAMGDKPSGSRSEDESARLAARVIQEELLKEFSSNSELSNWFGREDTSPPTLVVKKENPKNIQNQEKIKELEEQIHKLQKERQALNALLRPPSIPRVNPARKQKEQMPKGQSKPDSEPTPGLLDEPIDLSALNPSQQKILASIDPETAKRYRKDTQSQEPEQSAESNHLPPITPSVVSTRLSRITNRLAPMLDSLAAGVHDIELYRSLSDTVSAQILQICAKRLEERDTRKALRRLAIAGDQEGQKETVALRPRPKEDLGLILGALSRVERR
ncbi:hypothetical protein ARAM_007066 [Aspergillus rambellii]|uniref:Mis12-Mtw1 family protein n=1 Tax=Aspergillus rambellii TaxID=308745 RepID=A0A0F8X9Y8_9EURO|nr:hypothetical protein ARAM_007066 [Aspergillus rambellii]